MSVRRSNDDESLETIRVADSVTTRRKIREGGTPRGCPQDFAWLANRGQAGTGIDYEGRPHPLPPFSSGLDATGLANGKRRDTPHRERNPAQSSPNLCVCPSIRLFRLRTINFHYLTLRKFIFFSAYISRYPFF